MELKTLGLFQLGSLKRIKPLLALAYLALEGVASRRQLAQLLWPDVPRPDNNLRVALHAIREVDQDLLIGEDPLKTNVECDAVTLLETTGLDAYKRYPAPFLHGVKLSEVSAELEEWLLAQRERLAQHVQFQVLSYAEQSDPATAAHWAGVAYRLPGAAPADAPLLERLLRLSLPASALETELKAELQSFQPEPAEDSRLPRSQQHSRRLLGRSAEINTLLSRAAESPGSLTLISGPGGIGKSTLGRELLRELKLLGFGVTYLDAEALRTSSELLSGLAMACQPDYVGDTSLLALASLLGQRPAVLLDGVDRLNHLPELLHDLQATLGHVHWFVTSRRNTLWRAGMAAQDHFSLPLEGLSWPDADADLGDILSSPSVQLFVREAQRSIRGFEANSQNAALVVGIARRLLGHPLALTLAASWLRLEPLENVFARILHGAADLRDAADPNRRSLLLVAQRSWELLSPPQQETLLRLSVFKDFDPRHAADLGLREEDIDALLEQSFLEVYLPGSERLRIYPALEGLAPHFAPQFPELLAAAQADHAEYYLDWLSTQPLTAPAVGSELGNIVLALHTRLRAGTLTAEPLAHLMAYYDGQAQAASGTDTFHLLCDAAEDHAATAEVQATAQIACMWLAYRADRLLDAQTLALRFLAGALAAQPAYRMKALNTLASVRKAQGRYDVAAELTNSALAAAREIGDTPRQIMYSMNLVEFLLRLEDYDGAAQLLRDTLSLNQPLDLTSVKIHAAWYLLEFPDPDYAGVLDLCENATGRAKAEGDLLYQLWGMVYAGLAQLGLGKPRQALNMADECLTLAQPTETRELLTFTHYLKAQALYALGRTPQARDSLKEGLRLSLELGSAENTAHGLLIVAADLMQAHPTEAQCWLSTLAFNPYQFSSVARKARAFLGEVNPTSEPFPHEQVAKQLLVWL